MRKNGHFAIYMGKEYSSGKREDGKIILRSADIGDIKIGFEPCEPFYFRNSNETVVCIKYVDRTEIDDYYRLRIKAFYAGHEFEVMDETDEQVSIVTMTGDYRDWLELGMQCIDKGVYQKWIGKSEAEIKTVMEQL